MNDPRKANFTSSSIHMLCSNGTAKGTLGKPFFTYVEEKRNELLAGRSLTNEADANSTAWGKCCEQIAHEQEEIGLEYRLDPDHRYKHPVYPWSGAPDGDIPEKVVTDIKSPWTLTSFFTIYNNRTMEGLKKEKKEWYWQLLSNHILTGLPECELNVFMPKRSMLDRIRERSEELGFWFHKKSDYEMPWTADDSPIPVITKIRFTPPVEDVEFMTNRIQAASKCLTDDEYFEFLKKNKKLEK